jgi:hypothetical protein
MVNPRPSATTHLEVLEDVPPLRVVDGEHVPPGHEAGLEVPQLQAVQRQHVLLVFLLQCVSQQTVLLQHAKKLQKLKLRNVLTKLLEKATSCRSPDCLNPLAAPAPICPGMSVGLSTGRKISSLLDLIEIGFICLIGSLNGRKNPIVCHTSTAQNIYGLQSPPFSMLYRTILPCQLFATHLFVFEPGDVFGGEDEPVVPAASLHDPEVVDRHVAFPDHLVEMVFVSLGNRICRG